jgi:Zn-dependent peptidase ImmA (M78 family)
MARLSGLVEAGYSIAQIAIDLGRSQEAVRMKAHQTDLMPKRARRSSSPG